VVEGRIGNSKQAFKRDLDELGSLHGGVGRIPRLKEGKRRESLLKALINDVSFAQTFSEHELELHRLNQT
jgi:hypothetical protein